MNIAITGSTGLIGTAATDYFRAQNDTVTRIIRWCSRHRFKEPVIRWDIPSGSINKEALEGQDAVIHLAGANIAAKRWSAHYKDAILNSRVHGTQVLCQALAKLNRRPKVLISASAIGIYGIHPFSESLDEESEVGTDFLAHVCDQWEKAVQPALDAGIRVVHLRLGVVFSRKGGALAKMLLPFQLGLGGRIGSGTQVMSWVALDEIPLVIKYLIDNENIVGAVNCVSPQAVTNDEFTKQHNKNRRCNFIF